MFGTTAIALWCFIFGACTGSFLGLCVYRLPRAQRTTCRDTTPTDEAPISLSQPARSFCPVCKNGLHFLHIIPILSWLVLRGRCAYCKTRIPARDTVIEFLSGLFAALSFLHFGLTPTALMIFAVVCALILITFIGIDHGAIPDGLCHLGILVGLMLGATCSLPILADVSMPGRPFVQSCLESLIGIAAGAGPLLLVRWICLARRKDPGVQLSELALVVSLGALFGFECALFSIVVGALLRSLVRLVLSNLKPEEPRTIISYGPYLSVSALAYLFLGTSALRGVFCAQCVLPLVLLCAASVWCIPTSSSEDAKSF